MTKIKITAELIEEQEGGYTVYCPELDIYTQGDDEKDAIRNLEEAALLHIEEVGLANLSPRRTIRRKLEMIVNG